MSFQVGWYNNARVVHARFEGQVTLEEIGCASEEIVERVLTGTPPVHVLSDLREVVTFPTNLVDIVRTVTPIDDMSILGYTLIVGLNPVMRFLTSAISQFVNARFRTFNTVDDALDFLAEVDPSAITNPPRESCPTE